MLLPLAFAGFLLAHALVHVAFVAPAPPVTAGGPVWPFSVSDSWLSTRLGVGPDAMRRIAVALIAATILGCSLASLCVIGLAPEVLWTPAIVVGAVASLGLLVACFHPWLTIGIAIDLILLWVGIVAGWSPSALSPQL